MIAFKNKIISGAVSFQLVFSLCKITEIARKAWKYFAKSQRPHRFLRVFF